MVLRRKQELCLDCSRFSEIINGVLIIFLLPKREILLEELDDRLGVSEGLFVDLVNLLECVTESLLTKGASGLVVTHDLVVEH